MFIVLLVASTSTSLLINAMIGSETANHAENTSVGDRTVEVVFEITGDSSTAPLVEWTVNSNFVEEKSHHPESKVPFRHEFDIRTGGNAVTSMEVGGKSNDESTEFGCRITVDGVVVAEMTSSGGGEEITCSAVDGEK
jgi:hypothetical protein